MARPVCIRIRFAPRKSGRALVAEACGESGERLMKGIREMKCPSNESRNQQQFPGTCGELRATAAVVLALALALLSSSGQIFVENWQQHSIGEYTMSGVVVNASLIWLPSSGQGQVGMALDGQDHLFVADGPAGYVREYSTSGTEVNSSLVSGLSWPEGLALDGQGHFFVVASGVSGTVTGTVGEYATSGAAINATLISGLSSPFGLALDGNGYMYVACAGDGTIKKYTTSGTLVDAALVTSLKEPRGLVCDGQEHLFVANADSGTVGAYTTAGGVINPALISGLSYPTSLALDGNGHLFVASFNSGTVGEYTTAGDVINASLVQAPSQIDGLAVVPVSPAPSLQISCTSNQVVLVWTVPAANYVLETTHTPLPGASWLPLTNGVVVNGGSFVLTNPPTASSAFYRLHLP
jgi:hypothetical protein